jgi:hypothetical protein
MLEEMREINPRLSQIFGHHKQLQRERERRTKTKIEGLIYVAI